MAFVFIIIIKLSDMNNKLLLLDGDINKWEDLILLL
jgi:hypothetical protein